MTYGTNNEFGFDYLRDNMKYSLDEFVQREFNYAIVDEVDSILIDEARTPLIISGPAEESTDKYYKINRIIPQLKKDVDFKIDEKAKSAYLTEEGVAKIEKILKVDNLYDPKYVELLHHINQALKAHHLFTRDVDYIVKDGQVVIVDEFTGRLMPGRRFSDGLHQALEAKENVKIERENQTLATVTFQNYFRMYKKLAGMTGTADTEAMEFRKIYNLDVVVIPTNRPLIRTNYPDVVYRTEKEKFKAVVKEIEELYVGKARARRHLFHRQVGAACRDAQTEGHTSPRAQCEDPRARGGDCRPGGQVQSGHDLDEHGGEGHRYPSGRQPGLSRTGARKGKRRRGILRQSPGRGEAHLREGERAGDPGRGLAHPRDGAARIAPDRQPASRPFRTGRETPARRDFTYPSKTRSCASSVRTASRPFSASSG